MPNWRVSCREADAQNWAGLTMGQVLLTRSEGSNHCVSYRYSPDTGSESCVQCRFAGAGPCALGSHVAEQPGWQQQLQQLKPVFSPSTNSIWAYDFLDNAGAGLAATDPALYEYMEGIKAAVSLQQLEAGHHTSEGEVGRRVRRVFEGAASRSQQKHGHVHPHGHMCVLHQGMAAQACRGER